MNAHDVSKLHLTNDDFLRAVAANAVGAAMALHGRVLMTTADAQRMHAIFRLLHLDVTDAQNPAPGQVVSAEQPAAHPALGEIEKRLEEALRVDGVVELSN